MTLPRRYGSVMTGPQIFALAWSIGAVIMGLGWFTLATKFADMAERGPKWLWIQHSGQGNILGARAGPGAILHLAEQLPDGEGRLPVYLRSRCRPVTAPSRRTS